jgi:hypothetical protein
MSSEVSPMENGHNIYSSNAFPTWLIVMLLNILETRTTTGKYRFHMLNRTVYQYLSTKIIFTYKL